MLNEREFDNGNKRSKVPLICLVGASNELPEGEELDALYDRFLFRKKVDPVTTLGFSSLISSLDPTEARYDVEYNNFSHPSCSDENLPVYIDDEDIVSIRQKKN
jgi:hypothetical protein